MSSSPPNSGDAPFAHTADAGCPWEPLFNDICPTVTGTEDCSDCENLIPNHGHLNKVAWWAGKFAKEMVVAGSSEASIALQWGNLAGIWHDLGKFDPKFQARLRGDIPRANHSTAGAQQAVHEVPGSGVLLAYLIAGHHAGLADLFGGDSGLANRVDDHDYLADLPEEAAPLLQTKKLVPPIRSADPRAIALFTRMLFSCLVDADFLATEAFMNAAQAERRTTWPNDILMRMENALATRYAEFGPATRDIDHRRATVHRDCLRAAKHISPGLFTLTVPTGGGKTLASLAFALRHARKHGMRRVIYVVPYTSIIEQNAAEYRNTFAELARELGCDPILEHHSNFESPVDSDSNSIQDETPLWKLSAENWDAPLIVTTSVQFFESLYANRTSRCRKLHRIARSVVVFDEAQNLPPDLLAPCLDVLTQLTRHFGSTVVLCTATQPAIGILPSDTPGNFAEKFNKIALDLPADGSREIIRDVANLFDGLQRTTIENIGTITDELLVASLRSHDRVLCILNTKRHASRIFEMLGSDDPANLHLSAQLCPAHRSAVLDEIRRREAAGKPCRLIATTVVEAGVDLDFPVAYRAFTGLDSLAQAAGRCNRHGLLGRCGGQVFLFTPADENTPGFLTANVNAAQQALPDHPDPLSPAAIECYFRHYYFEHGDWDRHDILACFELPTDPDPFPVTFNFKTAAKNFRLIPDTQTPVIVPPEVGSWPGQSPIRAQRPRTQRPRMCRQAPCPIRTPRPQRRPLSSPLLRHPRISSPLRVGRSERRFSRHTNHRQRPSAGPRLDAL